ncbi:MAG: response regulator [Actinobacteria bacterium]|nr:response regulator [Actinomycetota bacterium]
MKKVLLVDDDRDFVESTRTLLEEKFEVVVAYDGDQGIAKAREEKPDLIILDVIMPVEDGFTAADEIAGDEELSKIPLILLTSFGSRMTKETEIPRSRGMEVSADDYIEKPVEPDELLERIARLIGE